MAEGVLSPIRIEYLPLAELVKRYHPDNPKEHDIGGLITSMRRFGFKTPGGIDEKSGLFAEGHGRTIALAEMQRQQMDAPKGIEVRGDDWYAPVIRGYEFDTPQELMAYLVTANRMTELGGWDEPKLAEVLQEIANHDAELLKATGYDEDDLQALLEELTPHIPTEDPGAAMDRAAELQKKWQVERGQLWNIGKHRLLCGDCTNAEEVHILMQEDCASLVVTDPPYGVAYAEKNEFLNAIARGNRIQTPIIGDSGDKTDIQALWKQAFKVMSGVMQAGAVVYCFMPQGGDQMMMMMMMMMGAGIEPRHELIWLKNNHVLGRVDYAYKHEPILYAWKEGGHKFYGDFQTSIIECDKPLKSDLHPTMKPVELIERLINNSSRRSEVVYDPFFGSGTTLVACEQTGRIGRGCEIEPSYCAVILDRMVRMGLTPELLNNANT